MNKGLQIIKASVFVSLLGIGCGDRPKTELLAIDIPWESRSNEQKLIGVWCSATYEPKGRTVATNSLAFKTILYFYTDGTMEKYFYSNFGGKDLEDKGTNVKVVNDTLYFTSGKRGDRKYPISIDRDRMIISGFISVSSSMGEFIRCQ